MKPENHSHKDAAVSFMRLVGSGRVREAYDRYVDTDFRHHNAFFHGDRESLLKAMEENAVKNPDKALEVKQTLEDGNFVVLNSHIRQNARDRGVAAVHIFRFEDDRISELWDVSQPIPQDSPNEYGMF